MGKKLGGIGVGKTDRLTEWRFSIPHVRVALLPEFLIIVKRERDVGISQTFDGVELFHLPPTRVVSETAGGERSRRARQVKAQPSGTDERPL